MAILKHHDRFPSLKLTLRSWDSKVTAHGSPTGMLARTEQRKQGISAMPRNRDEGLTLPLG